ncbi:hypothetical protein B0H14DRAFT_2595099 [Mycena olivaceomarginata]|nr:hypothetical protein B0H14DRAFT_2595099 [Mycena olivaceomarginata]
MADAVAVIQNQDRPLGEQWEMRHWYIDYDALAAANVSVLSTLFASYDYTFHLSRRHRMRAELLAIDTAVARLIRLGSRNMVYTSPLSCTTAQNRSMKKFSRSLVRDEKLIQDVQATLDSPAWCKEHTEAACPCGRPASYCCDECTLPALCQDCVVAAHGSPLTHSVRRNREDADALRNPDCACGQVAEFSCNGCSHQRCGQCFTGAHEDLPFHAIKAWSDILESYTVTSLRDLGLRIALGHAGATCAQRCTERVEVITVRGMVTVTIDFCGCEGAVCPEEQMRAHGWQPMRSNFVLAVPLAVMCLYLTMSTSSPGSSRENPLVFDARGRRVRVNCVSVEQAAGGHRRRRAAVPHAPPPRPRIYRGPASTIRVTPPPPPPAPHRGSVSMIQVTPSPSPPLPPLLPPPPFSACSPSQAPTSLTVSSPARSAAIRHSIVQHGGRTRQIPPPTTENLWLGPGRPQNYDAVEEYHRCAICQGVKAHPVSQVFPLEPATNAGIAIAMFAFVSGSTKAGNVPSVGPRSTARHFASSLRRRHCAQHHPVTVDRGAPALPAYFAEDVSTNAGLDAREFSYDMGDESLAPEVQEPEADGISVTVKPKRYVNSTWVTHRDEYLDEMLRLEGRGNIEVYSACGSCGAENPAYRCESQTCYGPGMFCRTCIVEQLVW